MFLYDYSIYSWAPSMESSIAYSVEDDDERHCQLDTTLQRTFKMTEEGIDHSGYIDIKQPPRVKGRKLKSWKKKWVVLSEMSIRSAGRSAAKVDVYTDEKTAMKSPADKHTFILEYVKEIRQAKSKTHDYAFEIVENEPVLLLAGANELENQTWMSAFRKIFWPDQVDNDVFTVSIKQNAHTRRLSLKGVYMMTITPEVIGIQSEAQNSYEWSLHMLKRFHLEADMDNQSQEVLTIECGPKSECGEAIFHFHSERVKDILESIKRNIFIAINMRKSENQQKDHPKDGIQWRNSVTSSTSSYKSERDRSETQSSTEQRYKDLLESPYQEAKRTRLMSSCSDQSETISEQANTKSDKSESSKRGQNVTFDTVTEVKDILSEPAEVSDEHEEDGYNHVVLNDLNVTQKSNIITTITVAEPGYQTKVLLDEHGYSHVEIKDSVPEVQADKSRSLSNISSHSSVSCRSASVGSRDSGIMYSAIDKTGQSQNEGTKSNRSTNSFDSAVSTSSTMENTDIPTVTGVNDAPKILVEIQEIQVSNPDDYCGVDKTGEEDNKTKKDEEGMYQEVAKEDVVDTVAKPSIKKSNSTGDVCREENQYEDLDKFRKGKKDLIKHLGMDPAVNPSMVPPALPARPYSHKVKRKFSHVDKRLFTLPFVRGKKKQLKEKAVSVSSSSDSDTECGRDGKKNADMTVKVWPLGNNSVMVANEDLYQPVAIERFLNDDDGNVAPQKRERSSSLNLNKVTTMKRHSVTNSDDSAVAARTTAMWKHNRNVSMHVDLIQRMNDSNASTLDPRRNKSFANDLFEEDLIRSRRKSFLKDIQNISQESGHEIYSDDEPIYAEVQPVSPKINGVSNPFPNLGDWKPPIDIANDSTDLDGTLYENDSMNISKQGDLFNEGFCSETADANESCIEPPKKNDTSRLLIDIFDDEVVAKDKSSVMNSFTAVDIFHMGANPLCISAFDQSMNQTSASGLNTTDIFASQVQSSVSRSNGFPAKDSNFSTCDVTSESVAVNSEDSAAQNVPADSQDVGQESIYMDMSQLGSKNESIYVMPSTLK